MSKQRRIQIPIDTHDEDVLKAAARKEGLSTAEWARRHLKKAALKVLKGGKQTPREALERLFALNAPVADVQTMIAESLKGRYGV